MERKRLAIASTVCEKIIEFIELWSFMTALDVNQMTGVKMKYANGWHQAEKLEMQKDLNQRDFFYIFHRNRPKNLLPPYFTF